MAMNQLIWVNSLVKGLKIDYWKFGIIKIQQVKVVSNCFLFLIRNIIPLICRHIIPGISQNLPVKGIEWVQVKKVTIVDAWILIIIRNNWRIIVYRKRRMNWKKGPMRYSEFLNNSWRMAAKAIVGNYRMRSNLIKVVWLIHKLWILSQV